MDKPKPTYMQMVRTPSSDDGKFGKPIKPPAARPTNLSNTAAVQNSPPPKLTDTSTSKKK